MLDSTTAADIPDTFRGMPTELIAGYVDGSHAWTPADWDRFPAHVRRVRLCIWNDRMDADAIDIEERNNDAKGAVPWVRAKWARGETPTVYCYSDAGTRGYRISDVRRECDAAGVKRPLFWIAKWDNDPSTFDPSGDAAIIAKQYAGSKQTGGHFDASVVADFWPGVDDRPVAVAPEHIDAAIYLQRLALGYNPWTGDPIDPKGELPAYAKPQPGWRDPYR